MSIITTLVSLFLITQLSQILCGMIAAGSFDRNGVLSPTRVNLFGGTAIWNGTTWSDPFNGYIKNFGAILSVYPFPGHTGEFLISGSIGTIDGSVFYISPTMSYAVLDNPLSSSVYLTAYPTYSSKVIVYGDWNALSGLSCGGIGVLTLRTWDWSCLVTPVVTSYGAINSAISSGTSLFIGGWLYGIKTTSTCYFASADLSVTNPVWTCLLSSYTMSVFSLAASSNRLFIGGSWSGLALSNNLVIYDLVNRVLTNVTNPPSGDVRALDYDASSDILAIGGAFVRAGNTAAPGFALYIVTPKTWINTIPGIPKKLVKVVKWTSTTPKQVWIGGTFENAAFPSQMNHITVFDYNTSTYYTPDYGLEQSTHISTNGFVNTFVEY